MTQLYAGNPASYPTNITIPSDDSSDVPQAPLFNTAFEGLADRTAFIFSNYASFVAGGVFIGAVTFDASTVLGGATTFGALGFIETSAADQIIASFLDSISSQVVGGIQSDHLKGIQSSVVSGIASGVDGGIGLTGSAADWVRYTTARTTYRSIAPGSRACFGTGSGVGWSINVAASLIGPGTNAPVTLDVNDLLDGRLNGATLTGVSIFIMVGQPHANVPNPMPSFGLERAQYVNGGTQVVRSLFSTGAQQIGGTPASGAAWYAGGLVQEFDFTPDQFNQIDRDSYVYSMYLIDENTLNAIAGNAYVSIVFTFSNIVNSAP